MIKNCCIIENCDKMKFILSHERINCHFCIITVYNRAKKGIARMEEMMIIIEKCINIELT